MTAFVRAWCLRHDPRRLRVVHGQRGGHRHRRRRPDLQQLHQRLISTGSGMFMAYYAGVPLKDMEFVQFHPTGLFTTKILMTEGARGEGGYLINGLGERLHGEVRPHGLWNWLRATSPPARSRPRSTRAGGSTARATSIWTSAIWERKRSWNAFPGIRDLAIHFEGVDPIEAPIPVVPSQHYWMGGIDTDVNGATVMPGLYAAGECACVSVHGANRLGGNSLLETIVFGRRAGAEVVRYLGGLKDNRPNARTAFAAAQMMEQKVDDLGAKTGTQNAYDLRTEMTKLMKEDFFLFRNETAMKAGLAKLYSIKERVGEHQAFAGPGACSTST